MVRYSIIGSGSIGNSYIFSCGAYSLLIDAGYSRKETIRRAEEAGFDFSTVKALFITHFHPDHTKSAGTFARWDNLDVYVSRNAYYGCKTYLLKLNIPENLLHPVAIGETVEVGPFKVTSFATSHDSTGSVGYFISAEGQNCCIVTDTGQWDATMVDFAGESDVLFLESNYEQKMLECGPYPGWLKERVGGKRGHLSNSQALDFLFACGFFVRAGVEENSQLLYNHSQSRIKHVYLIHISDNNNDVELLRNRYSDVKEHLTVCPRGEAVGGR